MEDAALIPVEERIHIETLRLLIENAKLRKLLNDYSEGILRNSLAKVDKRRSACARSIRRGGAEADLACCAANRHLRGSSLDFFERSG